MVTTSFADPLNPFQQDFTEAEDFINILRQANAPFSSFDQPLIDELLPLQQVADSWVQLALHSFGFAGSPLTPEGNSPPLLSFVSSPGAPDIGGQPPVAPPTFVPPPGVPDIGGQPTTVPRLPFVPFPGAPDTSVPTGTPIPYVGPGTPDPGGLLTTVPSPFVPSH
jgi:hypothetical protein